MKTSKYVKESGQTNPLRRPRAKQKAPGNDGILNLRLYICRCYMQICPMHAVDACVTLRNTLAGQHGTTSLLKQEEAGQPQELPTNCVPIKSLAFILTQPKYVISC